MHNWRLLLLAFLAVLQPIASFTERNNVDGREQCTDRNNLLRDSRVLYGTFRTTKLPEDYRLERAVERQVRRYEVREEDSLLNRPAADRRYLTEYRSERESTRLSPTPIVSENRRERTSDQRRLYRDVNRISSRDISRDLRNRDVARDFNSRHSEVRQRKSADRTFSNGRASRENERTARNFNNEERRSRISMYSISREERENTRDRRQIQENREARNVLRRARDDVARRDTIASRSERRFRERTEERRARSETRLQRDNKQERKSVERARQIDDDIRRSRDARSIDREESRVADRRHQRDTSTLDKQLVRRERSLEVRRENQQIHRSRTAESRNIQSRQFDAHNEVKQRDRSYQETREVRESNDRSRNIDRRNTQLERSVARKEARINDKRIHSLKGSEDRFRYNNRDTDLELERNDARREVRTIRQSVSERRIRDSVDRFRNTERSSSRPARSDAGRETRTSNQRIESPEERTEIRNIERSTRLTRSDAQRTERMSDRRIILDEDQKAILDSVDRVRNIERTERHNARREIGMSDRRYQTLKTRRQTRDSSQHNENKNIRSERFEARRMGDERFRSLNERRGILESAVHTKRSSRLARLDDKREARSDDRSFRSHNNRAELEDRRVGSRRVINSEISNMKRSERRSLDRRTRSLVTKERLVSSERNDFRNARAPLILRNRGTFGAYIREKDHPDESSVMNWQYALYTLQGMYLCSILMQVLSPKDNDKKPRSLAWWMTPRSLLKVD